MSLRWLWLCGESSEIVRISVGVKRIQHVAFDRFRFTIAGLMIAAALSAVLLAWLEVPGRIGSGRAWPRRRRPRRDRLIRTSARSRKLGELGATGDRAALPVCHPALAERLASRDESTRAWVASALGEIGTQPDIVIPALADLLLDDSSAVVEAASDALRKFGRAAEPATSRLLPSLRCALIKCSGLVEILAQTLHAVTAAPIDRAVEFFSPDEPDLLQQAIEALREATESTDPSAP
jgi:hypothetical protein